MKFMHLGDLHIGKSLGEFDLIEDQKYILDQLIQITEEESVDAVIIAGDVYDKSIPSEAAVNLFDYFICRLSKAGRDTFIISGNHDSDDRLNFGSSLFSDNHIYISAKFDGTLYKRTVTDSYGDLNVYLLPFVKASQVKHFYPDAEINSYDDAVRVIIEHARIDRMQRNLIAAHQFVAGKGEDPLLSGSEGASAQNVGLVEKIGYDCFESFDYAALGHIHSPQRVGREEVRYSGSPLKYSLSEVNNTKSVPIVSFEEKGNVSLKLLELHPLRDLRHIKGTMEKLLEAENIADPEDFIYVTLTDEEIVNDAMGIFQQYYPNTIKIDYDNSHTKEIGQMNITGITEDKPFDELIQEFYSFIYGCDMNEEELKMMDQVAREAGVLSETD